MRIILLLLITVALPVAWLIADLKGAPAARRTLGIVALLWSFGVAALVGALQDFNANVYFSEATKNLLDASVTQLKAGKSEVVVREWAHASEEFHPTYENRAHYRQIVDRAIEGMKKP